MNSIICDNCYKIFLKSIRNLPTEIKDLIFSFIQLYKLVNLNHYYYNTYHYVISASVCSRNYQNYVTDIIRKDNLLAFKHILDEIKYTENVFTKKKTYTYKKKAFKELNNYLLFLCKMYESTNCKNLLIINTTT